MAMAQMRAVCFQTRKGIFLYPYGTRNKAMLPCWYHAACTPDRHSERVIGRDYARAPAPRRGSSMGITFAAPGAEHHRFAPFL